MLRPFSATYEYGCRLAASGIPLDYLNDIPRELDVLRSRLHISELSREFPSRVLDLKLGGIGYAIAVRMSTNLPAGMVISSWRITSPWDHYINWDYDAADILPPSDHPHYAKLFNTRLSAVLNSGEILVRGHLLSGLICGYAPFQSIPKSLPNRAMVAATLQLTDNTGRVYTRDLGLRVDRRIAPKLMYCTRGSRMLRELDDALREPLLVARKPHRHRTPARARTVRLLMGVIREVRLRGTGGRRAITKRLPRKSKACRSAPE
jgi:hypothetical protein